MLIVLSRSGMEEFASIERERKKIDIIKPVSSHTEGLKIITVDTESKHEAERKKNVSIIFSYNEMRFDLIHRILQ